MEGGMNSMHIGPVGKSEDPVGDSLCEILGVDPLMARGNTATLLKKLDGSSANVLTIPVSTYAPPEKYQGEQQYQP